LLFHKFPYSKAQKNISDPVPTQHQYHFPSFLESQIQPSTESSLLWLLDCWGERWCCCESWCCLDFGFCCESWCCFDFGFCQESWCCFPSEYRCESLCCLVPECCCKS